MQMHGNVDLAAFILTHHIPNDGRPFTSVTFVVATVDIFLIQHLSIMGKWGQRNGTMHAGIIVLSMLGIISGCWDCLSWVFKPRHLQVQLLAGSADGPWPLGVQLTFSNRMDITMVGSHHRLHVFNSSLRRQLITGQDVNNTIQILYSVMLLTLPKYNCCIPQSQSLNTCSTKKTASKRWLSSSNTATKLTQLIRKLLAKNGGLPLTANHRDIGCQPQPLAGRMTPSTHAPLIIESTLP